MAGFVNVFGGGTIAPSQPTFLALALAADTDLQWPIEQAMSGLVVADTIEVVAATPGLNINLPDARQVSTGYTSTFVNSGAQAFSVKDALGINLVSPVPGTTWVLLLRDNSTEGGSWLTYQLGASVSVAVAAALAGAGLKAIINTLNQDIPVTAFNVTPTTLTDAARAQFLNWIGGVGILNLPVAGTVGNGWYVQLKNSGTGDVTVTPAAGTIDGAATKTFGSGTSAAIVTDGANWYTLGFGSGASGGGSGFDFVEIDVAGSGTFPLAGANLNRVGYRFVGVLTGNRTIEVPGAIAQYWVTNATTGAFSLFVKTAAQANPGIEILQNNAGILYCDGNNVVDAESSTVTFPISVAQGGTGAVNAAAARTNLGAGATGSSIFVAGNSAAAITALGILAIANVWTVPQTISSTDPSWELLESDAAADNRLWAARVASEQLQIGVWNDARNAFVSGISMDRTLNVIDTITLAATTITTTGAFTTNGFNVGYLDCPQNAQAGNYTLLITDRGKHIYHGSGDGAGDIYTIPSNASVPYPVGTCISFINSSASAVGIAINTDTLTLVASVSVGSRTLAQNSIATAVKVTTTSWLIGGAGLS